MNRDCHDVAGGLGFFVIACNVQEKLGCFIANSVLQMVARSSVTSLSFLARFAKEASGFSCYFYKLTVDFKNALCPW